MTVLRPHTVNSKVPDEEIGVWQSESAGDYCWNFYKVIAKSLPGKLPVFNIIMEGLFFFLSLYFYFNFATEVSGSG